MSKPVLTYNDLLVKKKNLEALLVAQKELIRLDIKELNEELNPLFKVFSTFSDFVTRDKKAWLLGIGANKAIDSLIKEVILSKAGWIAQLIIPSLIKNYSSNFIARHQDEWIKNLTDWLSHENGNGKKVQHPETKQ